MGVVTVGRCTLGPRGRVLAHPASVVVSQRPPVAGTRDALAALPVAPLRTWERGAIRLTWTPDGVVARGFRDEQANWDE